MPEPTSQPGANPPDGSFRAQLNGIPAGLWTRCPACRAMLYTKELERALGVCPQCGFHFPLATDERVALLSDPDSFVELDADLLPGNPLGFPDYEEKLARGAAKAGRPDGFVYGDATLESVPFVIGVANFAFMGGSMGSVYGEKVTRALERGADLGRPVVLVSASGGARMQEGMVALMQMARTSAAVACLKESGGYFISVLTDPTTGGVWASYASLGDINIAEAGALIGFAGPRVIEQSLKVKLPPGTHTAEFQLQHGMVDLVVPRRDLRPTVARLLFWLAPSPPGSADLRSASPGA